MEKFLKQFGSVWKNEIKSKFKEGVITYERQLQSILYHSLRLKLSKNYEIYVEPIFSIGYRKIIVPDIVITKGKEIVAIIELKCEPWGYPKFDLDIIKLIDFRDNKSINQSIVLGWKPKSFDWKIQYKSKECNLDYSLSEKCKFIIGAIARHDSDIIMKDSEQSSGFNVFVGFINLKNRIEFKKK